MNPLQGIFYSNGNVNECFLIIVAYFGVWSIRHAISNVVVMTIYGARLEHFNLVRLWRMQQMDVGTWWSRFQAISRWNFVSHCIDQFNQFGLHKSPKIKKTHKQFFTKTFDGWIWMNNVCCLPLSLPWVYLDVLLSLFNEVECVRWTLYYARATLMHML